MTKFGDDGHERRRLIRSLLLTEITWYNSNKYIIFSTLSLRPIYRVTPKKRNGILPVIEVYNDWHQWMEYILRKKKISRSAIWSRVLILEHIILDDVESRYCPFSAKIWLGINALRLAIIVSANPINRLCQWAFFTPAAYSL